jgi:hypothetical protein
MLLAVQLAVGNLGREDARSLLNETLILVTGLQAPLSLGSTNQRTGQNTARLFAVLSYLPAHDVLVEFA